MTFFRQNKIVVGLVAGLGSELLAALLLWAGLLVAGEPVGAHIRWFGIVFVPLVLILRHYAKKREFLVVTKTLIVILFITFVAFMAAVL